MSRFILLVGVICSGLLFVPTAALSATAGFTVPSGEYSVFVRSNAVVELRLANDISSYTSTTLSCADNNIVAIGNADDPTNNTPNYNSATMATMLTAWSTRANIQILVSDTDTDSNNNCGMILIHMQCEGCPSGL